MRHRIMTCKNHPNLRWECKDIAWTEGENGKGGHYNGGRNIRFCGTPSGRGIYGDNSGLHCPQLVRDEEGNAIALVEECQCPASDLTLAPEDALTS